MDDTESTQPTADDKKCDKCGGPVTHLAYAPGQTQCVNPECKHTSYLTPPRVSDPRGLRGPIQG